MEENRTTTLATIQEIEPTPAPTGAEHLRHLRNRLEYEQKRADALLACPNVGARRRRRLHNQTAQRAAEIDALTRRIESLAG